ncbi:outer membrane protein assembly factor BamE [Loktanella sp. Alg231-35]|uniref:outer membrane protein assembly factor BamE n=1 Tax=Loktanella sp. Alg231-35 TaxID=1922220 RepID=UPI000D54CB88|nr:outer membrane protein assembly factor BamE [Loktanella sp. Alg231-35]
MSVKTGHWQNTLRMLGMVALVGATTACTPIDRFHGFIPPTEEIETLQVGQSSKDEVIALFGTPIADRGLQNNTIYYAASHFRNFGPYAPEEVSREVLAIDFDANDRLRNVASYTLDDGRVVVLDRRVTEDGINDVTFLSQLLGSLGRIDAGQLLGEDG